jgi:hypothetical protein
MRVLGCFAALSLFGLTAAAGGGDNFKELDDKTWAAGTENKNVFCMFQAPW